VFLYVENPQGAVHPFFQRHVHVELTYGVQYTCRRAIISAQKIEIHGKVNFPSE
jgi:hypothetical protein